MLQGREKIECTHGLMSSKAFKIYQDYITSLSYDNYELKKEQVKQLNKKDKK